MFLRRGSRALRQPLHPSRVMDRIVVSGRISVAVTTTSTPRWFSESRRLYAVKPVLLADIGEGIVECEVIQWFVEPGARVEEFSPLCEVQSDKASVEITSRFTGTVKKLYYDAGEMARVGRPFVDIDIEGDAESAAPPPPPPPPPPPAAAAAPLGPSQQQQKSALTPSSSSSSTLAESQSGTTNSSSAPAPAAKPKGKMASLATPAVRHLSKELDVDINDIDGSGRDGRVLKEDIYRFVKGREEGQSLGSAIPIPAAAFTASSSSSSSPPPPPPPPGVQTETKTPLTPTQQMMFKSMTRSLSIPHFLYTDEINFTELVALRNRLNKVLLSQASTTAAAATTMQDNQHQQLTKLSYLPFIIKAVSMALHQFPILNARVETPAAADNTTTNKPHLIMRSQHNIGIAMDTPQGLLVPVIKDVSSRNILSIATELLRLQHLAHTSGLTPEDLRGGTITVSNIGNIGGTYLSPVIVDREVSILGIGRMRTVPAFDEHDPDRIVKRHVVNFSWSADHRVVDGATMARAAEVVRRVVEEPDMMIMHLR
ncbi:hypothetical protein E4U43_005727 [Claviceps pusilla]|uniref:Dihydrolipoamide acetyltransferase component of pyruvate dehydrogenase complex n=1 Tax=Claviceps pusilla TaxID=123648 RepID=A0A9P7N4I9_9HYPO|nr:hypothetical protein E4U43_005727 [Claviceps pusilla]